MVLIMRSLDFLQRRRLRGFVGRSGFGIGAVSTRAVRQSNAERGQGQRLPASVVAHLDRLSYELGNVRSGVNDELL